MATRRGLLGQLLIQVVAVSVHSWSTVERQLTYLAGSKPGVIPVAQRTYRPAYRGRMYFSQAIGGDLV
jgi:hypothetical protein